MDSAAFHARMMADNEDIAHQFAGEPELLDRGAFAGAQFSMIGENVAQAPHAPVLQQMWMASESHRGNMLNPEASRVGISVVERNGELYAVENFGARVDEFSLPQQEASLGNALSSMGIQVEGGATARAACSLVLGYQGEHRPSFIIRYTASDIESIPSELIHRIGTGRYKTAAVGACRSAPSTPLTTYSIAVLLYLRS